MAASSVERSGIATTPFPRHVVSKRFPSDHFPKPTLNFEIRSRRRRIGLTLASLRSDESTSNRNYGGGHRNLVGGAMELESALEDFPYDIESKDMHTLPSTNFFPLSLLSMLCNLVEIGCHIFLFRLLLDSGPLSSTHLSNSVSDGSRLRVAYQVALYIYETSIQFQTERT